MKRVLFFIGIIAAVLALVLAAAACKKNAFPTRIEVTMPPDDLTVDQGETIDFTGCVLTAYYADGTSKEIAASEIEVRKFSPEKLGTQTVELVYQKDGKQISAVLTVQVVEQKVLSLSWEGDVPTEYLEGLYFRSVGMTVYAHYKNGEVSEIKNYTITPSGKLTASVTEVVISYQGAKVAIPVTVSKKAPLSLEIVEPPTKQEYYVGDPFSAEGLVAKVTYNDGETATFASTDAKLSFTHEDGTAYAAPSGEEDALYVTATTSHGAITRRYDGLTIRPILPVSITAEIVEDPLLFMEGEIFSFKEDVRITVVYNNGTEDSFLAEESLVSFDRTPLTTDRTSILVWLGEYDAVKGLLSPITVAAPLLDSISVATDPDKSNYYEGDPFDPTGLVLLLHYDNDTEKHLAYAADAGIIYSAIIESPDEQRAYVVIEYADMSVEYEVTLFERPME